MSDERSHAQGQCYTFLNTVGYARKEPDSIICTTCRRTVVRHTAAGIADYSAAIRRKGFDYPQATVVEVKGAGTSFAFDQIEDDQWTWMKNWEERTGGTSWFWLLMGTDRFGYEKGLYPRRTYLMPRLAMSQARANVAIMTGLKSIPANELAVSRVLGRENKIYAEEVFKQYRLYWKGHDVWAPRPDHPFMVKYDINPNAFDDTPQLELGI